MNNRDNGNHNNTISCTRDSEILGVLRRGAISREFFGDDLKSALMSLPPRYKLSHGGGILPETIYTAMETTAAIPMEDTARA